MRGRRLEERYLKPGWKPPDLSGLTGKASRPTLSLAFVKGLLAFTAGAATLLLALIAYSHFLSSHPPRSAGAFGLTGGLFEVTEAVERAKAAVVQVHADVPSLGQPRPPSGSPNVLRQTGLLRGAGCLISDEGYIVTAAHLVSEAKRIRIILFDGKETPARLIGYDRPTDLAVVKIKSPPRLPALESADSSALRLGEPVIAIGHPPSLPNSVSAGIISGLHRRIARRPDLADQADLIQSDVTLLNGSTGGPLLDTQGRLVGVNLFVSAPPSMAIVPDSARWPEEKIGKTIEAPGILLSPDSTGAAGFAFAVPSNIVSRVTRELIDTGSYARPWLGIEAEPGKDNRSVLVTAVSPDSPALKAGLRPGDLITSADGHHVKEATEVQAIVLDHEVGDRLHLSLRRGQKARELAATLARLPQPR
jgi:S1-C subfamily serine protease